ncbi:MAG: adenylyltransferase/cytidyltransferase family protein, partial [Pseudomonadota bacterium]
MKQIGLFGGTFDPLHMGHVNSMITVAGELELEQIRVIPAYQSPFRDLTDGPTPKQRFEMVKRGLKNYD